MRRQSIRRRAIRPTEWARSGQALIEMTVALVALLAIVAALLQIGILSLAHLDTVHEARGLAAQYAMSDTYQSVLPSGRWIQEWTEGPDRRRYSRDDVAVIGSSHGLRQFVLPVARPAELRRHAPDNRISALDTSENPIREFDMVRATAESRAIPLLPVARQLLYRADAIRVESESVLVWTKGLE